MPTFFSFTPVFLFAPGYFYLSCATALISPLSCCCAKLKNPNFCSLPLDDKFSILLSISCHFPAPTWSEWLIHGHNQPGWEEIIQKRSYQCLTFSQAVNTKTHKILLLKVNETWVSLSSFLLCFSWPRQRFLSSVLASSMRQRTQSTSWAELAADLVMWPWGPAGKLQLSIPHHSVLHLLFGGVSWVQGRRQRHIWRKLLQSSFCTLKSQKGKKQTPQEINSSMRGQLARS